MTATVNLDADTQSLLRAARRISKELGHYEILSPLHLILGLLMEVRPGTVRLPQPTWTEIKAAMLAFAPPWNDVAVLSPGAKTPRTKRILEFAAELAGNDTVSVEHIWAALLVHEDELVKHVLPLFDREEENDTSTA